MAVSGVKDVADNASGIAWYVIHTKPRQEQRALANLEQQATREVNRELSRRQSGKDS
jgi:hypothetical protein